MSCSATPQLPPGLFLRVDSTPDVEFYRQPRLVTHIDDATIAALTAYYTEVLPADGDVLDLMSSWVSHLPPTLQFASVTGLGMNEAELAANPRLNVRVVHDLNATPALPFVDQAFDAAMIVVSVQYLVQPVQVFGELSRVLKDGGQLIVAMSHRCFPTKAIRAFQQLPAAERVRLVMAYCELAAGFEAIEFIDRSPANADPLWLVRATRQPRATRASAG